MRDSFVLFRTAVGAIASISFVVHQLRREGGPSVPRVTSAMLALLAVVPIGTLAIWEATVVDGVYGLGVFTMLPVIAGLLAALIHGWNRPLSTPWEAMAMGAITITTLGAVLLVTYTEGVICLLMAAPLAFPLAIAGGLAGRLLVNALRRPRAVGSAMMLFALLPSGTIELERAFPGQTPVFEVTTSIDIAASPEAVWKATLAPSKLERPDGLAFRAGIAYPMGAWIEGSGPAATRYCNFSTGKLVEPVLEWREPEVLRFTVVKNPEPMVEWNPFAEIHPAHLEGFLVSRQGQFRLTPIPGGTRLEATTWYEHGLYPAEYWRWWSDAIIHQIHDVVLEHIRDTVDETTHAL